MLCKRDLPHVQMRYRIVGDELEQLLEVRLGRLLAVQFHLGHGEILERGTKARIDLQSLLELDAGLGFAAGTQQRDPQEVACLQGAWRRRQNLLDQRSEERHLRKDSR